MCLRPGERWTSRRRFCATQDQPQPVEVAARERHHQGSVRVRRRFGLGRLFGLPERLHLRGHVEGGLGVARLLGPAAAARGHGHAAQGNAEGHEQRAHQHGVREVFGQRPRPGPVLVDAGQAREEGLVPLDDGLVGLGEEVGEKPSSCSRRKVSRAAPWRRIL